MVNNYRHLHFNSLKFPSTILFVFTVYFLIRDIEAGLSVLIGGLIYLLPHLWFHKVFFSERNITMKKIVSSLYKGTAGKLTLVALLFMGTFVFFPSADPYLIFGFFILMNVVQLITSVIMSKVIGYQHHKQ